MRDGQIAKSWLNDLEDIGQGQRSLWTTHSLMLVIICAQYGKNPSRTVWVTEQTRNAGWTDCKIMTELPWRYRSRSKVIMDDTPSHASDHLGPIWKESIQNCRSYRVDMECGMDRRKEWNQITPQQLCCVESIILCFPNFGTFRVSSQYRCHRSRKIGISTLKK